MTLSMKFVRSLILSGITQEKFLRFHQRPRNQYPNSQGASESGLEIGTVPRLLFEIEVSYHGRRGKISAQGGP